MERFLHRPFYFFHVLLHGVCVCGGKRNVQLPFSMVMKGHKNEERGAKNRLQTADNKVDEVEKARAQNVRRQMLKHRYHSRKHMSRPRWGSAGETGEVSEMKTWEGRQMLA